MKRTNDFRHVWREISDGNRTVKVLTLQQWLQCEGWENQIYLVYGGEWVDVQVSALESRDNPGYTE